MNLLLTERRLGFRFFHQWCADLFAQLIGEVETKIFDRLPDDTWFYPGHGNDSTIGAERPHLDEWVARGW